MATGNRITEHTYEVAHANVDGYGHVASFPTAEEAIACAQRHQHFANERGNHHGYHYSVRHTWSTYDGMRNILHHGSEVIWRG